jgi:hypothetical protein
MSLPAICTFARLVNPRESWVGLLNCYPLDLVECDLVAGPVTELRRARTFMRRHCLRVFERAAGSEIGRDARGAEGVADDPDSRPEPVMRPNAVGKKNLNVGYRTDRFDAPPKNAARGGPSPG